MEAEPVSTQELLLAHIQNDPGIHYRELMRLTGLANGVLAYHLFALENTNKIRVDRKPRSTYYYPLTVADSELPVLAFVRHAPVRQIISFLLENGTRTFAEIVDHTGKAPSTVSSHMKRLREAGLIQVKYGEYQLYRLTNPDLVADILSKYRATYTDRVVDNYVGMIDEL
jgi:predicted transcriptional regulator